MSTKRKRGGFPKGKNPIKGAFNILGLRKPSNKKMSDGDITQSNKKMSDHEKMSDGDITKILDKYFIRRHDFPGVLKEIDFPQQK